MPPDPNRGDKAGDTPEESGSAGDANGAAPENGAKSGEDVGDFITRQVLEKEPWMFEG